MLPIATLYLVALTQAAPESSGGWIFPVLQAIGTLFGGALVWLLRAYGDKLVALIVEKTGSPFLGDVSRQAIVIALSLYQTQIKVLKAHGQWDDVAKKAAKEAALDHLKMVLDPAKLKAAAGELGIDEFLGHQVEAAVVAAKSMAPIKMIGNPPQA